MCQYANDSADRALSLLFLQQRRPEPPHIHVEAGDDEAKFWLQPVTLAANHGFRARELNEIQQLVAEHEPDFVEAWNDHFGDGL